jgi:hypothetical protein
MMQGIIHGIYGGQEMPFSFPLYYSAGSIVQNCFKCGPYPKLSYEACDFLMSRRFKSEVVLITATIFGR